MISWEEILHVWKKVLKVDRREYVHFRAGEKSCKADGRDPKLNT